MKTRITLFLLLIVGLIPCRIDAQRNMEKLNRATVAVRTSSSTVLISWRILGPEYSSNATYNLYRGTTLIASDLSVSNFTDNTSTDYSYSVSAVINGTEQDLSDPVSPLGNQYFTIPVRSINGGYSTYNINDASVGDLDGDGEYEIVVKRLANDVTPAATDYHYLEAYELDGTFLWAINLGPNICNTVEVNFLVYDLDNDGKAEIATRTSDGMIDGVGNNIGDRDRDGQISYRSTMVLNNSYYRIDGPDYISIFDGETGREIAWSWYIDREPLSQWGPPGLNESQLGHRATKCMWAVAYLDGVNPSFVIGRGIYERIKLEAWDFKNGGLTKKWAWDSDPNGVASIYHGQGNHNLAAGDVDGDGRDEITYGAMAIDENGNGLYSTRYGHGDAGHLADINPNIAGLEFFGCHEGANGSTIPGTSLRTAANGSIQWQYMSSGDIGRCMAADIDPNYYGMEIWGSEGSGIYSCTGTRISTTLPTTAGGGATYNFGVWWDGDVQRELLDRTVITKWNASNQWTDRVATLYNIASIADNNYTKSNPCLMADIMGDWREEIIYRSADNSGMVVFVTPFKTEQRMYTLMHDPNYRLAIAWQNNSYNQPPNLGFYFGGGMATPPAPNISIVGENQISGTITLTASADNGQVNLDWTSTAISTNYQIMRDIDSDPVGRERIAITPNYTTTYTDTDVTNGTTYYYWIKATDVYGNVINSNAANATLGEGAIITIQENETSFCSVDGYVENNNVGFTGDGFANTNNALGNGVDYKVSFSTTGTYTFTFRYACTNDRPAKLLVNGTSLVSNINFPSTGAWTTWSTVSATATVSAGTYNVRLEATGTNGLGNIDYVQVSGITPSATNCEGSSILTYTLQENETGFCSVDGTVDNNNAGFTGTGFANTSNALGNGISWSVSIPTTGSYSLIWKYANGSSTDRTGKLMVDGSTVVSTINMPSTGSWTNWATTSGTAINLSAGTKIIRLEATNTSGLSNIDYMSITGINPTAVSCVGLKVAGDAFTSKLDFEVFPNPVKGDIINMEGMLETCSEVNIYIYNELGQQVGKKDLGRLGKGKFVQSLLVEGKPGMYIIKMITNSGAKSIRFIKE